MKEVQSFDRCPNGLTEPNQNKVDFFPMVITDHPMVKPVEDEESRPVDKTIVKNEGGIAAEKPTRLDRINVRTFKIDGNSFSIEWNI